MAPKPAPPANKAAAKASSPNKPKAEEKSAAKPSAKPEEKPASKQPEEKPTPKPPAEPSENTSPNKPKPDAAPSASAAAPATNCALVFVKPHAMNDAVRKHVEERFTAAKMKIVKEGDVKCEDIDKKKIIDQHYATIARYALESKPEDLPALSDEAAERFEKACGVKFADVVSNKQIVNAAEAMERNKWDVEELTKRWNGHGGKFAKLAPGLYAARVSNDDDKEPLYTLNGFYLGNRAKFTQEGKSVHWYVIEWAESDMEWKAFRGDFIGATNPDKAAEGSIRAHIFKNWKELGLEAEPTVAENGVHASAGPLEGFAERGVWTGMKPGDDPLDQALPEAKRGLLKAWAKNPMVTLNDKTQPVFDHLEDTQTSAVIAAINGYSAEAAAKDISEADEEAAAMKIQALKRGGDARKEAESKRKEKAAAPQDLRLTKEVLLKQDDVTSSAVLKFLADNDDFKALAAAEGKAIVDRDAEDGTKLAEGIEKAIARGVLAKQGDDAPKPRKIDVAGKTADEVAKEILDQVTGGDGGKVLTIEGLSGTGKGTTVGKIQAALGGKKTVCWSNGNVFRSVTHLVSQHCEEKKVDFDVKLLTEGDLLKECMEQLSFGKVEGAEEETYDIFIGPEKKVRVSEIQNTELKKPHISKRIPTVAGETQGEVIKFASGCIETLSKAGYNVIIEGRGQTLAYIPTPNRFELCVNDPALLGQRRAAQRISAEAASEELKAKKKVPQEEVEAAVKAAVAKLNKKE